MARRGSVRTSIFRQRNNIMENFSNGNPKHKVKKVPTGVKLKRLKCRHFFARFSKKIKSWQIDCRRWELLKRTPFGGIIKGITELDMNVEILDALLSFWDEEHCGFLIGGKIIPFTADDIALSTGLPNRGDKVLRKNVGFDGDANYCRRERALKGLEKSLDKAVEISKRSPNSENDRFFVQQMILYLWASVLFPTFTQILPAYLVRYVQNLEAIGNYNWAASIHLFLVKEIKLLKKYNERKKVPRRYMHGLFLAVNVWFFEHVNFSVDSRPSDPDVRPRMLKWVNLCKFWRRNAFLPRFREIMEDKVSDHIPRKINDHELGSRDNECHMRSRIVGGSDRAPRGEPSQARNLENIVEGNNRQKDNDSEIKHLAEGLNKQSERVSLLERKLVKLERLVVSKGWEIEEEIDDADDLTEHKVGKGDEEVHDIKIDGKSCIAVDKDHTIEGNGHPNLIEIASKKLRQSGKRKASKSTITEKEKNGKREVSKSTNTEKHLPGKRKRNVEEEQASIPTMKSSTRFRREDVDILVNVDDYASPIERKKEAKVDPLKYVGRELLTKKEREYLDAFCIKPMPKDEIVFYYSNIAIRRHSMVEYLRGGYTPEEIIDAYARILYESDKMSEDAVASFLYVPPMFLGLYRNKLGSYRTFLNSADMKSLEKVKFIFLPSLVSTANHWLLLVCDMVKRKWTVYDSLYDPRHREPAKEQIMLLTEYLHQNHGFDIRSWSLEYRRISPQQEPGSLDCGVFVMKFIEKIIRASRTISFRGTDAQLFRPQIAYKILCHG